jgi:PAS domain S-box-containing protein
MNRGRATYGVGGDPESVLGTITDVTEHRLAVEVTKMENEERSRAALDSAAIGSAICAPDGRLVHANQSLCEMTGYSLDELRAFSFVDLLHGDDRARLLPGIEELLQGLGLNLVSDGRYVPKGGGFAWVRMSVSVVRDGDAVRWVAVLLEDVSPRKAAEDALRLTNQLFDTTLAASSAVVFSQDLELRYTWIHDPALGCTPEQVRGKRDKDLFPRAQDAAITEAFKREVIATGRPARREVEVRHEGVTRAYDLLAQPQRDVLGAITGVVCAAVDITDQKAAERKIRERDRQLRPFIEHAPAAIAMFDRDLRLPRRQPPIRARLPTRRRGPGRETPLRGVPGPPGALARRAPALPARCQRRTPTPIGSCMRMARPTGCVGTFAFSRAAPGFLLFLAAFAMSSPRSGVVCARLQHRARILGVPAARMSIDRWT